MIKIANAKPISAELFPRQVAGANRLAGANVPTPQIYEEPVPAEGAPPMLTMDDVFARWPGARIIATVRALTPGELGAVRTLYDKIAAIDNIWADGHSGNMFFFDGPGGPVAGVLDADMIFPQSERFIQDAIVKNNFANLLLEAGENRLVLGGTAREIMDALFRIRFQ